MIQIIKTDISDKYLTLPMMIAEETGDEIEYVEKPTSDKVWHYYFFDGHSSIKPDMDIARKWDNKIYQYEKFKNKLKIPEYKVYKNAVQLINNMKQWKESFLITVEYGVNGKEFLFCDIPSAKFKTDIIKKYGFSTKLRVSKFIPDAVSISTHLIIANHDDFFISPFVVQHIEDTTLYKGGKYPCGLEQNTLAELWYNCSVIGNTLFKDGYIGLAHVDFLVANNIIYFGEINPRIAGSTPYMSYCLEREYGINLPYLEYYAVQNRSLPEIKTERKCNIAWDFKIKKGIYPNDVWISHLDIRKAFDNSGSYHIPLFNNNDEYIKLVIRNDKGNNI